MFQYVCGFRGKYEGNSPPILELRTETEEVNLIQMNSGPQYSSLHMSRICLNGFFSTD
jgi:hypothetical protein